MGLNQSTLLEGFGALANTAAVNTTWTGNITLAADTTISNTAAANPLTLTGIISSLAAGLFKVGADPADARRRRHLHRKYQRHSRHADPGRQRLAHRCHNYFGESW